jgi:ABC-2 type transport system ATP-binding protein
LTLSCRRVSFRYPDGRMANRDVSLELAPGKIVCLLGPNGAGKTTLILQITAQLRPTEGSILVDGRDTGADPLWTKSRLGVVPQAAGVYDALTIGEHVELVAALKGIARGARAGERARVLAASQLADLADRRVGTLSGGQLRRLLLALALVGDPPILILDEPTVGLDPLVRREVWAQVRRTADAGKAVLLTTHYLDEAQFLADRIALIDEGTLSFDGTLAELFAKVGKALKVVELEAETGRTLSTQLFDTHAEAQSFVRERGFVAYGVGQITLEDVYVHLFGRTIPAPGGEPPR